MNAVTAPHRLGSENKTLRDMSEQQQSALLTSQPDTRPAASRSSGHVSPTTPGPTLHKLETQTNPLGALLCQPFCHNRKVTEGFSNVVSNLRKIPLTPIPQTNLCNSILSQIFFKKVNLFLFDVCVYLHVCVCTMCKRC